MGNVVFPKFPGQAFSVQKRPIMRTLSEESTSGVESRLRLWTSPLWEIELTFNYLQTRQPYSAVGQIPNVGTLISSASMQANDFDALSGFFLARGGSFDSFLFDDPTDNAIVQAVLGIGDSSGNAAFQSLRQRGEYGEPAQNLNGTPQACGTWTASLPVTSGVGFIIPTPVATLTGTRRLNGYWQTQGWPCYYTPGSNGTTGASEPDWRKASLLNDSITDGTTTWINQGPVTQLWIDAPMGLSGYAMSHAYAPNAAILPASGNAGGYYFISALGGTSGGSAPTWPQTFGASVTDSGGTTWTNFGIAQTGPTGYTLIAQVPASYSISATGVITYYTAMPIGTSPVLSSGFYYRVRFKLDDIDFEEFMNRFYVLKKVAFRSIKL